MFWDVGARQAIAIIIILCSHFVDISFYFFSEHSPIFQDMQSILKPRPPKFCKKFTLKNVIYFHLTPI